MPTVREFLKGRLADDTEIAANLMATVTVTVADVRRNIRDLPRFNEIVRQELSDDEIADAIMDAIAEFNAAPPMFTQEGVHNFPSRKLLQDMAVVECMERLILWHARNQFSAEDSGVQVPIHEQWQPIKIIADQMEAKCQQAMKELKTMLNLRNGWGGMGSPLGFGW